MPKDPGKMPGEVPYRPLGLVMSALEACGFQVSHSHDDLVFIESNMFLLRMEEKGEEVSLFFNVDSDSRHRSLVADHLMNCGCELKLKISSSGTFRLTADERAETLRLEFLDEVP